MTNLDKLVGFARWVCVGDDWVAYQVILFPKDKDSLDMILFEVVVELKLIVTRFMLEQKGF